MNNQYYLDSSRETDAVPYSIFVGVGILLLAGFILPFVGVGEAWSGDSHTRIQFINIKLLGEAKAPGMLKFMMVYPAIAGILLMVLSANLRNWIRSLSIIAVGALPWLVLLGNDSVQQSLRLAANNASSQSLGAFLLPFLAWTLLFVGGLALRYQPYNRTAAIIGSTGGAFYVIAMLIPTAGKEGIPLFAPFRILSSHPSTIDVILALGGLANAALMIMAAIFCFRLMLAQNMDPERSRSVFTCIVAATGVVFVMFAIALFYGMSKAPESLRGALTTSLLVGFVKMLCWIGGLMLLIPLGLTDLLLNRTAAKAVARNAAVYEASPEERLNYLISLRESGVISEEEFEQRKQEYLSQMQSQ